MAFRIFKYIYLVLVVSVLAGCAPGIKGHFKISPEYSYNPKMRVAVIPFSSEGSVENGNGEKIANLISTELIPYYFEINRIGLWGNEDFKLKKTEIFENILNKLKKNYLEDNQ